MMGIMTNIKIRYLKRIYKVVKYLNKFNELRGKSEWVGKFIPDEITEESLSKLGYALDDLIKVFKGIEKIVNEIGISSDFISNYLVIEKENQFGRVEKTNILYRHWDSDDLRGLEPSDINLFFNLHKLLLKKKERVEEIGDLFLDLIENKKFNITVSNGYIRVYIKFNKLSKLATQISLISHVLDSWQIKYKIDKFEGDTSPYGEKAELEIGIKYDIDNEVSE